MLKQIKNRIKEEISIPMLGESLSLPTYRNYINCICHNDNRPSMYLYETKAICFSCNASLDVFDFVMQYFNCDFKKAICWLANEFLGIDEDTLKQKPQEKPSYYWLDAKAYANDERAIHKRYYLQLIHLYSEYLEIHNSVGLRQKHYAKHYELNEFVFNGLNGNFEKALIVHHDYINNVEKFLSTHWQLPDMDKIREDYYNTKPAAWLCKIFNDIENINSNRQGC